MRRSNEALIEGESARAKKDFKIASMLKWSEEESDDVGLGEEQGRLAMEEERRESIGGQGGGVGGGGGLL